MKDGLRSRIELILGLIGASGIKLRCDTGRMLTKRERPALQPNARKIFWERKCRRKGRICERAEFKPSSLPVALSVTLYSASRKTCHEVLF